MTDGPHRKDTPQARSSLDASGTGLLSEPRGSVVTSVDDGNIVPSALAAGHGAELATAAVMPHAQVAALASGPIGNRVGRYTVLGELGSGGMGVVYKAWDPALDRAVALKVMLAGRLAPRRLVGRFLDEARAIARLDHPALVAVYDIGVVDECPYFTMEYVEGNSLRACIHDGPLDPLRACRILARVARGLDQAHVQGIIHRDVKPGNILVDRDDNPRLIDFGIARFLEATDERTRTGQVVGTPAYMAPEQATGDLDAIGPPTDVFGLGAVLYRTITGRLPGRATIATPETITEVDGVPRDVAAICHRALSHAPSDRYPTVAALADDLERFVRGEPVEAALPGLWRRMGWRVKRARSALIGAGTVALLAVGVWLGVGAWDAAQLARREASREATATVTLHEALDEARRLRGAGHEGAADEIESEVTVRQDVQGTRALARFHLDRADSAIERQAVDAAVAAASSAYASATDEVEQFEAMVTLGRLFVELRKASELRAIVDTLRRRFPGGRPEIEALALEASIFDRDMLDATERAVRADLARAPILLALSTASVTDWDDERLDWTVNTGTYWRADVTGDGRPELRVASRLLQTTSPDLPEADLPPVPDGTVPHPLAPGMIIGMNNNQPATVYTLDGDRWIESGDLGVVKSIAYGDLDGDGQPSLFNAMSWHLYAHTPDDEGTWQRRTPHPPTETTRIEPRGVFIGDFGSRGPALVVGSSGWRTYDLRIYTAAADGGLTLAARQQLGEVFHIAPVPRPGKSPLIAVAVRSFHGDPRLFPPDAPHGLDAGIHLFEWTDAGLQRRASMPIPGATEGSAMLAPGDFDGDGRTDIAASVTVPPNTTDVLIYRNLGGGRWSAPIPLLGLRVVAAAQVDDDPASELIVRADRARTLWVLGAGDAPLPRRHRRTIPALPDSGATPGAEAIEDLVRLGLIGQAIEAWRLQMRLGIEPHRAAMRAGELAEQRGRHSEAAELFLSAAAEPDLAASALSAAARAWRSARRWSAERAVLDRLSEQPLGVARRKDALTRRAELDTRLAQRTTFDFRAPLDDRWQVQVPDRMHLDTSAGTLTVRTDLVGRIARLPVEQISEHIAIEVEMETPRVEYGGVFTMKLMTASGDDPPREVAMIENLGWGGGSLVFQRAFSIRPDRRHVLFFNRLMDSTEGDPLHVRIEIDQALGRLIFIEYTTGVRGEQQIEKAPFGERTWIEIASNSSDQRKGQQVVVELHSLVIDGLRVAGPPADAPLEVASRTLAEGHPESVLKVIDGIEGEDADAIRAAALYDLGRWQQADEIVLHRARDMAPGTAFERFLRGRILRDPIHFAPLLRRARGPDADALLWRLYYAAFDKHPRDLAVGEATRAVLLETDSESPADAAGGPHGANRFTLWKSRAVIHRFAGRTGAARADLERCAALLEHLPAPEDGPEERKRGEQWAALYVLQAEVDADAGDLEEAADRVRAALAKAPAPELVADVVIASRSLRRLMNRPVWSDVSRAAAWSTPETPPDRARAP